MLLTNLILPGRGTSNHFDVEVSDTNGKITSIKPTKKAVSDYHPPSRVLPTLCHPHIHLDKPFLLTSHNEGQDLPDYLDLALEEGSFDEALAKTAQAKARYTHADLIRRGSQLIAESIQAGVTSMRAFVEVDHVTKFKCIEAGIELKQKFARQCYVQLCVFAQDPVFTEDKNEPKNRRLVEMAIDTYRDDIDVLGSTPYVEGSPDLEKQNIEWAVQLAKKHELHLDLHLDYNLGMRTEPMIWHLLETLGKADWTETATDKTVVLGHCSRLTLFSTTEVEKLAKSIHDAHLPVYFVGLPTSDIFMMGRAATKNDWGRSKPRGTLQILELIKRFDLKACIGINNVGNAFTPFGSCDPLKLASLGVGMYQAGTPRDAELLFECISALAQEAIGLKSVVVRSLEEGAYGLFMVVENNAEIEVGGIKIPARRRLGVADMVWDPPEISKRKVVGHIQVK